MIVKIGYVNHSIFTNRLFFLFYIIKINVTDPNFAGLEVLPLRSVKLYSRTTTLEVMSLV